MAVSCKAKCGKSILLSFTLLHWLAGGALLVLGTSILLDPAKLYIFHFVTFDTLEREYGLYLAYALISLGVAIFLVSWTGCCGAIKETRWLLVLYFLFLLLLALVEVSMSTITILYREEWLQGLEGRLRNQLLESYGNHTGNTKYLTFSEAMDFAQYKFGCCGITDHTDYAQSKWLLRSPGFPELKNASNIPAKKLQHLVPLTCCVLKSPEEPYTSTAGSPISTLQRETPHGTVEEQWQTPNVENMTRCQLPKKEEDFMLRHIKGCYPSIEDWFRRESTILIAVGFSVAFLQILGVFLTTCLCRNLGEDIYHAKRFAESQNNGNE